MMFDDADDTCDVKDIFMEPPTNKQILEYEIRSSLWAMHCHWPWLRRLAGKWFAFKVNRKYARYRRSITNGEKFREQIIALRKRMNGAT